MLHCGVNHKQLCLVSVEAWILASLHTLSLQGGVDNTPVHAAHKGQTDVSNHGVVSEPFPMRWSTASNEAVKQCKAPLCQHKMPRWSLLSPSDTAGEVCPSRGRGSESHWAPPLLPSGSFSPTSDSVQRPLPQQSLSQEHFQTIHLLHITLMEVATFNGQNAESTNFLRPRNVGKVRRYTQC